MGAAVAQIPGGPSKGTALTAASEADIRFWLKKKVADVTDDPDGKYASHSRRWIEEAKTVLVGRGIDVSDLPTIGEPAPRAAPQPKPQQSSALAKAPQASGEIVGSAYNASQVNQMLEEALATAHLVSPATVCGSLPPGCEVAISMVKVDPNTAIGEVASVGGDKLSLSGFVLKRIGAAAGVSWDMNASGRLDNGADPHYCHYRAVAWVRNFDGSMRCLSGEVEIDMREGSPQIEAMRNRSRTGNVDTQIRDTRLFLIRHAETKAKLRAIADMGVKRSYTATELQKPFKVARLMWTGRTDDPELRHAFAMKTADAMIGASAAMFGGQPAPQVRPAPMALPTVQHVHALGHSPPPIGAVDPDYEEIEQPYGEVPDAKPSPKPTAAPVAQAQQETKAEY